MSTTKKRVLITDRFSSEAYLTLSQQSFLEVEKTAFPSLQDVDLSGVHALVIRSRTHITDDILTRAKQLQVIVSATSGFDHIDLKACNKWGVTVMFTPEANIESAAQLTFGLVISCSHRIHVASKALKAGDWAREAFIGSELSGKTYGIVGLGRIGLRVAELAQAFRMRVIAYDPYIEEKVFNSNGVERAAYEELLKSADIISFHVPLTRETHHMLNRSHFEYINRGVILINTSRGSVLHELDLIEALQKGWVAALGADVFEKEPLPRTSGLLNLPQVVLSPHIGANTHEAFAKASEQASIKIIRFFIDGSTSDTLPPKAQWYGAIPAWTKDIIT